MSFSFPHLQNIKSVKRADLIDESPGPKFQHLKKSHKLSDSEYQTLRDIMGRAPTMSELGIFSAMWSEHCSYKSSKVHLRRFPTTGPNVVVGPGENAGVVRLADKLCVAFKMESHNHPSYIEPYQGSATGVGGILRDVFCMGSRPVANLNCLRFGQRSHPRTPYLKDNVIKGIGDYGNCVGIPTVGGNISFDKTYDGNCLVNAMTVGVIHEDRIFKGYASGVGNLVVYVGSATGRDGIHGATMASDSFDSAQNQERGTIQVGDPFTEKLLLEATLEVLEKGLVVGLQDMGAAGLTSSSFEMAGRAGNGLYMDLDLVPVRTTAMTAYELMLSESQERMLMVIEPSKWEPLKEVLEKWQLAYGVIGCVTDTGKVQATRNGILEIEVPVDPLTDRAPRYERPITPRKPVSKAEDFDRRCGEAIITKGLKNLLQAMLVNTGSKNYMYRQYDQHIGVRTSLSSNAQGAAVLWMRSDWAKDHPYLGLTISSACNERYCAVSPRKGGAHAVLKSARMIAATGGEPLAITDCLNFGNPEDPMVMWEFSEAVDGISDACKELSIPVVSGNVSLYNTTDGESIAPTPMIGMVGKLEDVRHAVPAVLRDESEIYLLAPKNLKPTFGGSLVARELGFDLREGDAPAIDWESERQAIRYLKYLSQEKLANAARDVGAGGVGLCLAKMIVEQNLMAKVTLPNELKSFGETFWVAEASGSYVLALKGGKDAEKAMAELLRYPGLSLHKLGEATRNGSGLNIDSHRFEQKNLDEQFNKSLQF